MLPPHTFQNWVHAAPYAFALTIAAISCAGMAYSGWRRRTKPAGTSFALVMAAASAWALFYSFELMTPVLEGKVIWAKLEYLGIATLPLFWYLVARAYTGSRRRLSVPRLARPRGHNYPCGDQ
jgi:hypothetical protein